MNKPLTRKHKCYCKQLIREIDMYYSTIEYDGKQYFYLLGCDHENGSAECTECKSRFIQEHFSK